MIHSGCSGRGQFGGLGVFRPSDYDYFGIARDRHLTAEILAREGHTVCATMRDRHGRTREAGDALLHLAKEQSLAIRVLDMEVKDESAIQDAVGEILRETPRIDIDMVVSLILPQKGNLKADAGN
ncbi:MAG TPA: hypothetical protein VF772_27735 [Terriglobales bacterium]